MHVRTMHRLGYLNKVIGSLVHVRTTHRLVDYTLSHGDISRLGYGNKTTGLPCECHKHYSECSKVSTGVQPRSYGF